MEVNVEKPPERSRGVRLRDRVAAGIIFGLLLLAAAKLTTFRILNYPVLVDVLVVLVAGGIARTSPSGKLIDPVRSYGQSLLDIAFLLIGAAMTLAAADLLKAAYGFDHNLSIAFNFSFIVAAFIIGLFLNRWIFPHHVDTAKPRLVSWTTYFAAVALYIFYQTSAVFGPLKVFAHVALGLFFIVLISGLFGHDIKLLLRGRTQSDNANWRFVMLSTLFAALFGVLYVIEMRTTQPVVETGGPVEIWRDTESLCADRPKSPLEYCVRVHFGTTRNIKDPKILRFGDDYSDKLHVGYADIRLPLKLPIRNGGNPGIEHPLFNKRDRFRLESELGERIAVRTYQGSEVDARAAESEAFIQSLKKELAYSEKSALIYIHGFNQSFDTALGNAAQLAIDLTYSDGRPIDNKLDPRVLYRTGAPILFSWPTYTWDDNTAPTEKYGIYDDDRKRAAVSASKLAEFFQLLIHDGEIESFNIILHSMGNRVFMESIDAIEIAIANTSELENIQFKVIHAASEYGREEYSASLTALDDKNSIFRNQVFSDVTIYTSSTDQALKGGDLTTSAGRQCAMGRWSPNASSSDCRQPFIVGAPISTQHTTIDATGFVLSSGDVGSVNDFGHNYYIDSAAVLSDMACGLDGANAGDGRRALIANSPSQNDQQVDAVYWSFDPNFGSDPSCKVVEWRKRVDTTQDACDRVGEELGYTCDEIRYLEQAFDAWREKLNNEGVAGPSPSIPKPRISENTLQEEINGSDALQEAAGPKASLRDVFEGTCAKVSSNIRYVDDKLILYFPIDSDQLDLAQADALGTFVEPFPNKKISIIGFADSSGSERHNNDLARRRAISVQKAIGDVYETKIESRGEPSNDVGDNGAIGPALRCALDRKVEISILEE